MRPYPLTHVGTPSHLGHMDRVAATMPSQAHAGAAQEAPDIGQWEGQDVPLVRPSSCNVKGGIPSSRRYLPTYLSDPGGVAGQGADVAGLPGRGSGAPHHGCGRQQLAPPGFAQRPRPLALPPAQPAAAAAPAPTQAAAQVKAQAAGTGELGGGAGPPGPRPPHGTARRKRARHLPREGVRRQRARGRTCCPAAR